MLKTLQLPLKRIELAVKNLDRSELEASLPEAMTATAYFVQARTAMAEMDPLNPVEAGVDAYGTTAVGTLAAEDLLRDATTAFAFSSVLKEGCADLHEISSVSKLFVDDPIPEWSGQKATNLRGTAAVAIRDLVAAQGRSLQREFELQLQLWDWLRNTIFQSSCMPQLCNYVHSFWKEAVSGRRFEMSLPAISGPEIERALADFQPTNKWLAGLLLVCRHAARVRLSAEFVELLGDAK